MCSGADEPGRVQDDAEQGDADTPDSLGRTYDDGEAPTEDDREAMRWFRVAAQQGDARAQFNLGTMYDHGGVSSTLLHGSSRRMSYHCFSTLGVV